MISGEIKVSYKSCIHSVETCFEHDTGYAEYGCGLGDSNPYKNPCYGDMDCPLVCKFSVTEDE